MTKNPHRDEQFRILLPRATAQRLAVAMSRRRFLALTGGAAAAAALAACGSDDASDSATNTGATTAGTTGATTGGTAAATSPAPSGGDIDRSLNMYTFAEYDDPDLLAEWGDITISIFDSNEEAVQKLSQVGDSSGYDLIVPTGVYIPQLVRADLLEPLDTSRIPNFANLDAAYVDQPWDKGNKYSVCKDWGTTGWIYDTRVVTSDIATWSDFIRAAQTEASGQTSVLDAAPDVAGIYFWANGIDWTTEDEAELDACEEFLVNEFATHIKDFDSYPGIALTSGQYALSQVWNGDARQGLLGIAEAGDDPEQYRWGIGAPETELWMDNWCIAKGAPNVDAAYDFINFILDPENSFRDLEFHGYHTGLKGIEDLAKDIEFRDMVFFTPEQVATMKSGAVNAAQDRLSQILSNVKAKAAG
jgi:spermidine/putrescine transport system substrate-binding protein